MDDFMTTSEPMLDASSAGPTDAVETFSWNPYVTPSLNTDSAGAGPIATIPAETPAIVYQAPVEDPAPWPTEPTYPSLEGSPAFGTPSFDSLLWQAPGARVTFYGPGGNPQNPADLSSLVPWNPDPPPAVVQALPSTAVAATQPVPAGQQPSVKPAIQASTPQALVFAPPAAPIKFSSWPGVVPVAPVPDTSVPGGLRPGDMSPAEFMKLSDAERKTRIDAAVVTYRTYQAQFRKDESQTATANLALQGLSPAVNKYNALMASKKDSFAGMSTGEVAQFDAAVRLAQDPDTDPEVRLQAAQSASTLVGGSLQAYERGTQQTVSKFLYNTDAWGNYKGLDWGGVSVGLALFGTLYGQYAAQKTAKDSQKFQMDMYALQREDAIADREDQQAFYMERDAAARDESAARGPVGPVSAGPGLGGSSWSNKA